jgi:hypothetical protein
MELGEKKLRTGLLVLLLVIWGGLVYRIYSRYFRKPVQVASTAARAPRAAAVAYTDEPYELLLNYANPFDVGWDQPPPPAVDSVPAPAATPPAPPTPPVEIEFPPLEYRGFIHLKNGRTVAVVALGPRLVHWQVREKIDELTLLNLYGDSIRVQYQGKKRVYRRTAQ